MFRLGICLALARASLAAVDCFGNQGVHPDVQYALTFRDMVCQQNACAGSDQDLGNNHYCEVMLPYDAGKHVVMERNDPAGKYPNCESAFSEIIQTCFSNQGSQFTGPDPNGLWRVGDEWYWIHMTSDVSTVGQTPGTEDVLVDDNGDDIKETLEGPAQFCQGFSPGGSNECITIPDGCRIAVPEDNTQAVLDCSDLPEDP